jgi:HlyD family secretion protein
MTILVNVDESDIGMVRPQQAVRFTVQAWPERTFEGTVRTVRLESKIDQSVVTYTAVVDAANTDGALFPGMTATAEFIVAEAKDVLCAPNAALRFAPDEGVAVVGGEAGASGGGVTEEGGPPSVPSKDSSPSPMVGKGRDGPGGPGGGRRKGGGGSSKTGTVWTVEGEALRAHAVTLGIRGATCAEVSGADLTADMELVLGVDRSGEGSGSSPFSTRSGDARRPGGF